MAFEHEVRRQAGLLRDAAWNAENQRRQAGSCADSANQWWKGAGGEAFLKAYQDADGDAARLLNSINHAADQLDRLPALIRRAEQERSRAAAHEKR